MLENHGNSNESLLVEKSNNNTSDREYFKKVGDDEIIHTCIENAMSKKDSDFDQVMAKNI